MKLKNKFLSAVALLPVALGGMMVSCEDHCSGCNGDINCSDYKITSVASADSINSALGQMYAEQTVIIKGTGLSTTREAYLVDSVGNRYAVELNPTFVTDNNVIITMKSDADLISTESIILVSQGGCTAQYGIAKPVSSPSIKMFYCEFVPDGGILRVAGSAFLEDTESKDTLKVWFEQIDEVTGNPNGLRTYVSRDSFTIAHDQCELLITVPAGLPNSTKLGVENSHGIAYSSMRFRDTRNIWLDFDSDTTHAGDENGATLAYDKLTNNTGVPTWRTSDALSETDYANILSAIGGSFPASCNNDVVETETGTSHKNLYGVLATSQGNGAFNKSGYIYYAPFSMGRPKVDLRGQFAKKENMSIDNLVLKFEIYVPSSLPWYSFSYIVFSAYGTDATDDAERAVYLAQYYEYDVDNDAGAGRFSRDLTSNTKLKTGQNKKADDEKSFICNQSCGTPGAWFHPASAVVNEESGDLVSAGSFSTDGWMTVAIPLTSGDGGNFAYNISEYGFFTQYKVAKHCGPLNETDFCNFFIEIQDEGNMQKNAGLGNLVFVALDNFRIVPEDNGGVRFSKNDGATATSKYPY